MSVTTYGPTPNWVAEQFGILTTLVQEKVPADQIPELMGAILQLVGRVARGKDIALSAPRQTNIIITSSDITIRQNN